jgi:hypothetical protein
MIVTVTFDTKHLFRVSHRPAFERYFKGEVRASAAAVEAGMSGDLFRDHIAAIFAAGNSDITITDDTPVQEVEHAGVDDGFGGVISDADPGL